VATVIKVRRANLKIEIDKYTPKVGEFVFDKENKKLLYGDNFAIGGHHVIFGDLFQLGNNEYYGSNKRVGKGFYNFPIGIDIEAKSINGDGNSILSGDYFLIPDQNCVSSFGFKYSPFWDKDKDVNFKITYTLDGPNRPVPDPVIDPPETERLPRYYVKLVVNVYLLYNENLISTLNGDGVLGSNNTDRTDYIEAYHTVINGENTFKGNIGSIDILNLQKGRIPRESTFDKKEPPEYVIVKITRATDDTFDTGTLKILNIFAYQIINGHEYGYYFGGAEEVSPGGVFTNLNKEIQRFTFPMNCGNTVIVGNLTESRFHMAAFNSSSHGYSAGGQISSDSPGSEKIESFKFAFNGDANIATNLIDKRTTACGVNCSSFGFVIGGVDQGQGGDMFSTIERVNFGFAITTIKKGNLLTYDDNEIKSKRSHCMGLNSSLYGFCLGGFSIYDLPHAFSYIDKFSFPFDLGNCTSANYLTMTFYVVDTETPPDTIQGTYGAASFNSSLFGYVLGGHAIGIYPYNTSRTETVSKYNLSGQSNSEVINDLKISGFARSSLSGCNSTLFGFSSGGAYSYVLYFNQIEKLSFPFNGASSIEDLKICGNLSNSTNNRGASCDGTDFVTMFV